MKIEKSSQDLENEVIYAGSCTHCGACNAFCPHMDFDPKTGQAFVVDECSETVGLCYNACPRTFLPISELEQKLFGETRKDLAVGVYKEIIQVKSKNSEEILYNLIDAAFEKKIISTIVMGKPNESKPPVSFPIVVDSAADAKALIPKRTMDMAGPLVTGIGAAYHAYKRDIGILANPCHFQGLAKILASDFNTGAERTSLRLAYACSSGGMRGCKFCTDYSGEFSDVTYSPWGAPKGQAMLIVRTEVGQKLVNGAKEMGLLEVTNEKPDLSEMKKFLNRKRKKNFLTVLGKKLITADYLQLTIKEIVEILSKEDAMDEEEILFYE